MTNHRIIRTFKNTILISLKDAKLLPKHRCELYQYFPVPASNLKEVHYKVKLGKVSWNMSPNLDGSHFLMRCICPYLFSFFFALKFSVSVNGLVLEQPISVLAKSIHG